MRAVERQHVGVGGAAKVRRDPSHRPRRPGAVAFARHAIRPPAAVLPRPRDTVYIRCHESPRFRPLKYHVGVSRSLRLLIVEASVEDVELLADRLRLDGSELASRPAADEAAFLAALDEPLDLILADYTLPSLDAPRMLALLKERDADVPLIVVTGS